MNSTPEKQNAARGRGVQSDFLNATSAEIIPELTESIKARLETGQSVRLVDFPERQRAIVLGILAALMDELPVRSRWTTLRESHVSQTRLRVRAYWIPAEHLRLEGSA